MQGCQSGPGVHRCACLRCGLLWCMVLGAAGALRAGARAMRPDVWSPCTYVYAGAIECSSTSQHRSAFPSSMTIDQCSPDRLVNAAISRLSQVASPSDSAARCVDHAQAATPPATSMPWVEAGLCGMLRLRGGSRKNSKRFWKKRHKFQYQVDYPCVAEPER